MRLAILLCLTASLAAASPLGAQDRPNRGKIDGVERDKDKKSGGDGGNDCDCGSGWLDALGDALAGIDHVIFPRNAGRGYQPYPYAEPDSASAFALHRTQHGRRFGTLTAAYFSDAGSTTKAGRFSFEGAAAAWYFGMDFNDYIEPLATTTDHMQTWRFGIGALPSIGRNTIGRIGFASRGVVLEDGTTAVGPELELGVQAFPRRPFGVNVTGRLADVSWSSGGSSTYRELNTTGSIFLGRLELQAGWHWMKIGDAAAFGGPTIGTRLWF